MSDTDTDRFDGIIRVAAGLYTLGKTHVKDVNLKDADVEEIIRRLYRGEVKDESKEESADE